MVMASDFVGSYSCIISKDFIKQNPNYSVFFTALFQYMTDKFETEESYGFSISNILEISPGFTKFVSDGKFDDILRCALDYGFLVPVEDDPGKYCFDFDTELGNQFSVISKEQFVNFYKDFFEDLDTFDYKQVEYMFRCYVTIIKYHNYFTQKKNTNYEFSVTRLLGKACVPLTKKNRDSCLYLLKILEEEHLFYYHQNKEGGLYIVDEI